MSTHAAARSRMARHEEVRTEILEAAARAIAEHGYHGMSMRRLARSTKSAPANFYNYFASKEEVLFALQSDAFETLIATVERALEGIESPVARLYVFVFNHVGYVAEHRAVMRVLVHEASALPAARRKVIRRLKERYFQIGRGIVADILEQGCRKPGARGTPSPDAREVERATYSIFGMLNWSYGWYEPDRHGTPHDVAGTIHSLAMCGLVAHCPHRPVQEAMERHLTGFVQPPLIGNQEEEELRD